MDLAARLREEARGLDERRLLVLAGEPAHTRERARAALDAAEIDRAGTTYLGPSERFECASLPVERSHELLGTTQAAVVLDCHERCEPNALGRVAGSVEGGGLLLVLAPPLEAWPRRRDAFDEQLAVEPFELEDVGGRFRRRLVGLLRAHRGVAIVDVEEETVVSEGLAPRAPRLTGETAGPTSGAFPEVAYEACLTGDQRETLAAFERLREPDRALVVEADRGRGKSSVAGLAAAALAMEGLDVLVTAPRYRATRALFDRAGELLRDRGALVGEMATEPRRLETDAGGSVVFREPLEARDLPGDPDRVVVDEAAALPVDLLAGVLAAPGAAFVSTVHGYEGAGRGFSVRFREHLAASSLDVEECSLAEPVRYAPGDPVEVWATRALALDARPPAEQLVARANPETVEYRQFTPAELVADEELLRAVFGLLVLGHYRTEPNDLARMLDAPNISVHALVHDGWPVSVALLAREGGLDAETRAHVYEGGSIRGHLVPDLLGAQLRDERAGAAVGDRVLRIATHEAVRSRGLGSRLLGAIRERSTADWLGVGFGATPRLVEFWRANGLNAVHLSTSRDDRSGEHSAVMLEALTDAGEALLDRHGAWFRRRLPGTLADSLSTLDPDVVRAVCRAAPGTLEPNLTQLEWRLVAGIPHGAAIHGTAPRPVRRLTLGYLLADGSELSTRQERLLVTRALQCRNWEAVAQQLAYGSRTECMRALGDVVETLVERYGTDQARAQLERLG